MKMNSYGWVTLIVLLVIMVAWVGGEAGFTTNTALGDYTPGSTGYTGTYEEQPASNNPLEFIGNLAIGNIAGMPLVFTVILDCIPFLLGWIIYRQIRGQD